MYSWLVFLPPLLVIVCAILTHRVVLSLGLGIVAAGLIVYNFNILETLYGIVSRLLEEALSIDHIYTFSFLILLGILIELMTHAGGISAYTSFIRRYLHDARSAQTAALVLSCTFFLDDYLNSLTVGSVMKSLTDLYKVPRVKLAFLLAVMSAPLCVLVPASSWIATIITQLQASGISQHATDNPLIIADPFTIYLKTIPYLFYPLLLILAGLFIVRKKISFGPMYTYETTAQKTGDVFAGKSKHEQKVSIVTPNTGFIMDFLIPMGIFMVVLFGALLYSGGYFAGSSLLVALQNAQGIWSIFIAVLVSLSFSIFLFFIQKKLTVKAFWYISHEGFSLMKNSLVVLLLAWTLSGFLKNDLHTGEYFAQLLVGTVQPALLPIMFFLTSILISASTGSAWGTIAIMFPIAVPMLLSLTTNIVFLYPTLGAIISGAIAGGHISPIADAAVIAATSAGANQLDLIRAQLPYILTVIGGSCFAFLATGYLAYTSLNLIVSYSISIVFILLFFIYSNKSCKAS